MHRVLFVFALFLAADVTASAAPQPMSATGQQQDVCASVNMSPEVRALHLKSKFLRRYDRNCNGVPDDDELAAYTRDQQALAARSANVAPAVRQAAGPPSPAAGTAARAQATPTLKAATGCPQGFSTIPFVRDKYSDITGVSASDCSVNLQKVGGATFSWSNDRIAGNRQWSAAGVVGAQFFWLQTTPTAPGPYVNIASIAPLVRFQRVANSKLVTKDIDVLSPGISGEALIDQVFDSNSQLYVRGRGNINSTFAGMTNSWSGTLELQPIYAPSNPNDTLLHIGTPIPVRAIPSYWTFSPLVRAQYFGRVNNSNDPLFLRADRVFRAGPSISLVVTPFDGPPIPEALRKIVFMSSYTWYQDFVQNRNFVHYDMSLAYNITDNFGVKVSYEKGQIDESGKEIDLTSAGLTVKF